MLPKTSIRNNIIKTLDSKLLIEIRMRELRSFMNTRQEKIIKRLTHGQLARAQAKCTYLYEITSVTTMKSITKDLDIIEAWLELSIAAAELHHFEFVYKYLNQGINNV